MERVNACLRLELCCYVDIWSDPHAPHTLPRLHVPFVQGDDGDAAAMPQTVHVWKPPHPLAVCTVNALFTPSPIISMRRRALDGNSQQERQPASMV